MGSQGITAIDLVEVAALIAIEVGANLTRIERITIQVGTEGDAPMAGTQAFPLNSDVRLRNI